MENQEQNRSLFDPEQIDEQVEDLASIQDPQMQSATPGGRTIAALKRITGENEQILNNVWTQLTVYEAARQAKEPGQAVVDLPQSRRKKEITMMKMDFMPQFNTQESQPEPPPRRRQRLSVLVAILLVVLVVSSFVTISNLTHPGATTTGSHTATTPSPQLTVQPTLPVPSPHPIPGPAAANITSVGLSDKIDTTTGLILHLTNQFTVDQGIYLSCEVSPSKEGGSATVSVKWYANNHPYTTSSPATLRKPGKVTFSLTYGRPAEGKAEIYVNDQLAMTLLFVVEPHPHH